MFWKFDQRLAESGAFLGVVGGQFYRALHRSNRADREREALLRQLLHQLDKAVAFFLAEQVFRRHHDIVEEQFGRIGGVQPDLVEVAPATIAVGARRLDHDQREAFGAGSPVRATTMTRSAACPLVIKVFWPLMT